jgi:small subunit ribosomal protein S9
MSTEKEYIATGRRKTAVASVRVKPGTGNVTINGKALQEYFPVERAVLEVRRPLEVTELAGRVDVRARVKGGGITGQAGAVSLGLSRALTSYDEELRKALKSEGLLRRDPRSKERKKYGQPGARKRFQFSKR